MRRGEGEVGRGACKGSVSTVHSLQCRSKLEQLNHLQCTRLGVCAAQVASSSDPNIVTTDRYLMLCTA